MAMNQDAVITKLLERGVIARTETRGKYNISRATGTYKRDQILARFAVEIEPYRYVLNENAIRDALNVLRTISRSGYHGAGRSFVQQALARIVPDADGVVRSFGVEYEIYALNRDQEDKLARLLDTLPAHVCERDGSLDSTGVEIVFAPVGAEEYIRIVNTLKQFVIENNVRMEMGDRMAGMHTTYGVNNAEASISDLQIRLNRFALAVKAFSTQVKIKEVFGRDFGNYRELPRTLVYNAHGNAFSCNGRPSTCWECRLPSWKANPEKMVEFLRATEGAFHHPVNAEDLMKVFAVMGSDAPDMA
nr:MAG TPA: hypothetical protein [Caudoviricetes sp.]